MRLAIALLALLLIAAAPPLASGPVLSCAAPGRDCTPTDFADLRPDRGEVWIEQDIQVDPRALPLERTPMVWITAMASAEIFWNGRLIGLNGRPAADAAGERPGRFVAAIPVPPSLVRAGANRLQVRMTSHHLWLPVQQPVHFVAVSLYETPRLPGIAYYLPALLTLGALLASGLYFGAAAMTDRADRLARWAAAASALATAQLGAEVARAFIPYPYPWHLVRVAAIALLAAATAVAASGYAAHRFAPNRAKALVLVTAAAAVAALLFPRAYDLKALAAVMAGLGAILVAGFWGWRSGRVGARAAMAGAVLLAALLIRLEASFLDGAYYVGIAATLAALVAEQVLAFRRARTERDGAAARAAALTSRLAEAQAAGENIVELRSGARTDRAPEHDILYVRAADDYCEAVLADGRRLLVTQNLTRMLDQFSDRFLRVHKSYAVNRVHVTRVASRPGGGQELQLADGRVVPVGRRYRDSLRLAGMVAAAASKTTSRGRAGPDALP
ncbi:LytTR family DNA-binding domain-containing protein [Sphingosinicella terrae]|uniref:LytTR family DNA-binding domain-containing protein n=1 Tax=Sphingosinicella terrae TaxID=2172047 RepID=UPI0013B46637|nr:LytTR family DNA-binding domain-containing protein [Sphingosinicella terrae]